MIRTDKGDVLEQMHKATAWIKENLQPAKNVNRKTDVRGLRELFERDTNAPFPLTDLEFNEAMYAAGYEAVHEKSGYTRYRISSIDGLWLDVFFFGGRARDLQSRKKKKG